MAKCGDCKWFFPLEDDPTRGDCVRRESDEQSEYWTAKPMGAEQSSEECAGYKSKG